LAKLWPRVVFFWTSRDTVAVESQIMSGAYSTLVRMMLLYATSEHSRYLHSDYHLLRRTTEMNRFLHWLFHIQFVTPMCLIEVSLMHRKMIMTTVRVGRCHTPITLVCVCDTDRHVLTWHIKATLICPRNDIKHTRMHSAAGGLPPPGRAGSLQRFPDPLARFGKRRGREWGKMTDDRRMG